VGLTIEPVTPDRWRDLEYVFGERGAASNCWCMWFRQTPEEMKASWGAGAKEEMRGIVAAGREPGLIAYREDGEPVGWVTVAPRQEFLVRLERSRTLRPAPGTGVWSVLCFVVKPGHRRQGVAAALLDAAVAYARAHGARAVEGHPIDPGEKRADTGSAYVGVTSMFEKAGFTEIDRRGARPVYRLTFDR
jgi:GNAT superfamily N-acetyltransferase